MSNDDAHFCKSFKVFLQTKSVFFCQWKVFVKPVQKYFCFGNLDPQQLSCSYLRIISVQESIFLQIIQSISYKNHLKYLSNRCKSIFVLEIWIHHSYLIVIWGSVSTEASHVHLCWQRCRLNLYFVTLHSFPSFLTSEVSFLLEELIPDNWNR